jgi:4-amino-4-deoxy-L-arabinose transferase-like glycosyltransferase
MRVRAAEWLVDRAARIDVTTLKRIVAFGILLRVVLLVVTSGSNDSITWERFGRDIAIWGVLDEYRRTVRFNHPPLMGLWSRTAVWITDHVGVRFSVSFKLLPFAADMLGVWLIYSLARRRGGELQAWRAAAVFSTCLLSIVITGHHGNTDSACAVLALVAAALLADGRRPFVAGLALAATLNVKLIPLVLVPAFGLLLRDARERVTFGAGLALGLTPFLPLVIFVRDEFYNNAIAQPRSALLGRPSLLSSRFDFPGADHGSGSSPPVRQGQALRHHGRSLALGAWRASRGGQPSSWRRSSSRRCSPRSSGAVPG